MQLYEELAARGLIAQVTNEDEIREMINAGKAAVITGLPGEGSTLLQRLWMRFEDVDFYMVGHDGSLRPVNIADRTGLPPLNTLLLPPAPRLAES